MQGKNILIIGASQGIGRDVAEYLISLGANIIAVARQNDKLLELKNMAPNQAWIFKYDISDLDHIEEIYKFCQENGLLLDGLVYSAGMSNDCPVKSIEGEDTRRMYDVNVLGYIQAARFFSLKKYSSNGSSIVGISSAAAKLCQKGMSIYASSKAAMNAFSCTLSKELVKRKIRVNTIGPAMVDTDMYAETIKNIEGYDEYLKEQQPYGVIPVRQVSKLIKFLLSEDSEYITSVYIPITAGWDWSM